VTCSCVMIPVFAAFRGGFWEGGQCVARGGCWGGGRM